jgi:DNA-binding CsgD family transcriptional regulator
LVVHAAPLSDRNGEGRIAIVLAPADPLEITPLRLELHALTKREQEVARLLARGLSTAEIASRLWISRHTVKDHTRAVYAKLDVTNRRELTAKLFFEHHVPAFDEQPAGVRERPMRRLATGGSDLADAVDRAEPARTESGKEAGSGARFSR